MKKFLTSILIILTLSLAFCISSVFANNQTNDAANAARNTVDGAENVVENTAKRNIWCHKKWYKYN